MKLLRNVHIITFLVFFALGSASFGQLEDSWYSVSIDGSKAGWAHDTVEVDSETGNIISSKVQNMTLSRGGINISIAVTSTFTETKEGKPISVNTSQEAMGQVQETSWEFGVDTLTMTTVAGGQPIIKKVPLPKNGWLTPGAVRKMFRKKMSEGATAITYRTMSPELGPTTITVVMTKKGEEERDVMGTQQLVTSWESVNDKMPIIGTEYYTNTGLNVGSSMNAGFGAITNAIMEKHDALSPVNEVPELMVSLFVEPSKKIDNTKTQLAIKVTSKDGTKLTLPSAGYQRSQSNEDGSVTLTIDLASPTEATESEKIDEGFVSATAICDGTDTAVSKIANETLSALPTSSTKMEQALALRAKVYEYIDNKGMSTAFASASQTARNKEGDCSEHAVLLCGLLRAANIPSRGVMGLVYVPNYGKPNGVFGWHMWSQALVDGKWIDLDATLTEPFTVGHIAAVTTSLSDEGMAAEMSGILATIGNLDVEVIEADQ